MSSTKNLVIDPELFGEIKSVLRRMNDDYVGHTHGKESIPSERIDLYKKAFEIYGKMRLAKTTSGKRQRCPTCQGQRVVGEKACQTCFGVGAVTKWLKIPHSNRYYIYHGKKIKVIKSGHTQSVFYMLDGDNAVKKMSREEFKKGATKAFDMEGNAYGNAI